MKSLLRIPKQILAALFLLFILNSCNKDENEAECGVCKSAPVDIYYTGECFSDWDQETCEDFNNRQVNHTSWTWIPNGNCN